METISLKCKDCGGIIDADPSKNVLFCPYCGSKSMIPESDQVRIARIKANERIEREKERQKAKNKRELYMALPLIVGFASLLLMAIIGSIAGW